MFGNEYGATMYAEDGCIYCGDAECWEDCEDDFWDDDDDDDWDDED